MFFLSQLNTDLYQTFSTFLTSTAGGGKWDNHLSGEIITSQKRLRLVARGIRRLCVQARPLGSLLTQKNVGVLPEHLHYILVKSGMSNTYVEL